jgi:hypothetical protein
LKNCQFLTLIQVWISRNYDAMGLILGVPRWGWGCQGYSHFRLINIMRGARVFILSLPRDVTEIIMTIKIFNYLFEAKKSHFLGGYF